MEETSMVSLTFHEVADLFPLMTSEEYQALRADIALNGLREPIWTYQGRIIDGRNRSLVCQELGLKPMFREWDGVGSLVDFVVSLNLKRRHLTTSQRAMIAVEIEKYLAGEAEQRRLANLKRGNSHPDVRSSEHREYGRSSVLAGRMVSVGKDAVLAAKHIAQQAPDLRKAVIDGTLPLAAARQIARLPQEQRGEVVKKVTTGKVRTARMALLELRKAAHDSQARAAPSKPRIVRACWESWLSRQPPCDLLLTDPPYSTEIEAIEKFAVHWLPAALAKVKESGRAYVCIGAYPRELRAYLTVLVPSHLSLRQLLVWTYKNTLGPAPTHTHHQNWQAILAYVGQAAPPLDCPLLVEQMAVQEINAPDGRLGNRYHRWQKPDALGERLIRHSTRPGDLVLDPFAGTGTFLLAAHRLGREALGADCSASMLAIAEQRGCTVIDPLVEPGTDHHESELKGDPL